MSTTHVSDGLTSNQKMLHIECGEHEGLMRHVGEVNAPLHVVVAFSTHYEGSSKFVCAAEPNKGA